MSFTEQLNKIQSGDEENRIEALRQLLNYPLKQRDPEGSQFWFIRAGEDEAEAQETSPIAVGFDAGLNEGSDKEIKQFLTSSEKDQIIRGHYLKRVGENQPVIYLLLPTQESGQVAFILPSEGKLRQRSIQTFGWDDPELPNRLRRLQQESLEIAEKFVDNALNRTPQLDWVFYESAKTAQELAQKLAEVTRRIEQAIPNVHESEGEQGYLHQLLKSFQKELLSNLKLTSDNQKDYSFADIYAQTIAYGLFTARVFSYVKNPKQDFNRRDVGEKLPETNPFLRQLFSDISARSPEELGDELIDAISETFAILRAAQMDAILADFRNKMNREDIIIRFYEDFLKAYKPEMREKRGVYYTPEPVVSYMVRSVDELIKDKFDKPLGIADPEVMILDPACGTGTFLLWIFQLIHQRFQENSEALTEGLEDKSWSGYVTERLLPRIFGFELLMAPYAIAHLKLGLFLEETGYQFENSKRLGVYLLNTLEDIKLREEQDQVSLQIPQLEEIISEEAKQGSKVKKNEPIMVVIGNPPYSGHSQNNNEWIKKLVNDYYFVDGQPLGERNSKWLQDDYVKFIRFAQWRIDKSGQGIIAFINPHGFLNNSTFRGMRQQLIHSFDGISIYNLHGNSKKTETALDGSKDENVFDIQQGVSINLAVKGVDKYINHAHLYGLREDKYKTLSENTINTTDCKEVNPQSEFYLFIPQDTDLVSEYEQYLKITEIMPINGVGMTTARDHVVIDFEKEPILERATFFRDSNDLDEEVCHQLSIPLKKGWNLQKARELIKKENNLEQHIKPVLYRPFDNKYIFYHDSLVWRTVKKIMKNMLLGDNFGLCTTRQINGNFTHVFCSRNIINDCTLSNATKERSYLFPLYIEPETDKPKELQEEKRANFSQDFLNKIEEKLDYLPTPEAIFYYIYAVFHSPTYRSRYAEFLKLDFPRVPLTSNKQLFTELSNIGEQLVQLHLMTSPKLNNFIKENGGNREVGIGTPKTAYKNGTVQLNKQGDCFTGIPEEVWNFYIGGYQVCHKWLKDRKGRTLSDEDILHYQRIIVALKETIRLMQLIDEAIPGFPIE